MVTAVYEALFRFTHDYILFDYQKLVINGMDRSWI